MTNIEVAVNFWTKAISELSKANPEETARLRQNLTVKIEAGLRGKPYFPLYLSSNGIKTWGEIYSATVEAKLENITFPVKTGMDVYPNGTVVLYKGDWPYKETYLQLATDIGWEEAAVYLHTSNEKKPVIGFIYIGSHLAVTPEIKANDGYAITHIPSGFKLHKDFTFTSLPKAKLFVENMAKLGNWENPTKSLVETAKIKLEVFFNA